MNPMGLKIEKCCFHENCALTKFNLKMSEFCKFACHNSDYRLLIKEEGRYISTRREAGNELLWLSKQFILKY